MPVSRAPGTEEAQERQWVGHGRGGRPLCRFADLASVSGEKGIYKTGKKFSVRGTTVLNVRRVRIVRNSDYDDLATALRQLGLLPPGL